MSFRKFAALVPALVLAACTTPQPVPTAGFSPPDNGYAHGIDMAADSSDVAAELQGRPWLQFVARYYRDPSSRYPALSPSEARRLSALGVKIVTVWEWHSSTPSYFTYASGYNDALNAVRQARSVGQPPGSAIYFAVDFNAHDAALYQVDQYFRGVNAGLAAAGGGRPIYRVGVYGSGAVCAAMKGRGLAQYAWLSGSQSWDGTAGYEGWNIRQAAAGARYGNLSFDHDANDARADYGGFRLANYAGPDTPAAAAVTVAAAAPAAAATVVSSALAAVAPPPSSPAPPPPAPLTPPAIAKAGPPASSPSAPVMTAAKPPAVPALAAAAPPPALLPAPVPSAAAAEVAALVAAEPAVREIRHSAAGAREEEPARVRGAAHAAKGSAGKRNAYTVALNNRALAAPMHHLHVEARHAEARHAEARHAEAHRVERRVSAPRRAEEHAVAHIRHTAERHHAEKPHHEKSS